MFNNFKKQCEINLLENMMFSLFYCENLENNYLYDKIKTSYNLLSEKYPYAMIKVYSTNQIGCFKHCIIPDIIEIGIFPSDFIDYKIDDLQLQNIIWKVILAKNININTN